MNRNIIVIILLTTVWLATGCGQSANRDEANPNSQIQASPESAAVEAQQEGEEFNLMDYSALETTSGVFQGEYEEEVNDEITVRVVLRVKLEEGRITGIEFIDTAWVHKVAAREIPRRIIESQRLPVEAVSGASVASWSIMTATALALEIDLTELDDFAAIEE
jgi:uncharacterized protein with FMN-binding domain